MYSAGSTRALPRVGFPIRRSRDQRLVSTSPALIAAAHVLHRLLAPRHPPYALVLLIEKNTCIPLWSFQGARGIAPAIVKEPPVGRSLKTQQQTQCRGRHIPGESGIRTIRGSSTGRTPTGVRAPVFPRKEVIQPQLPLRLPCYDFTPIIDPTFDGSLPCGLGHRLRVLPTFVV
jgi:hypothetical protein